MSRYIALGITVVLVAGSIPQKSRAQELASSASISHAQFRSFRWIVGRWHGVGFGRLRGVGSFYEEYVLVNDSTIYMRMYADSTFTSATDSTRFELRGGRLTATPARGTAQFVTRFSGDSVQWSGRGTLYVRITSDSWRAVFQASRNGGEQAYYELRRMAISP